MIEHIEEERILREVMGGLDHAEHTILATRLREDGEQDEEYEQKIRDLQKGGIRVLRRVFSRENRMGAIDVRQFPFLRMLLIDNRVLFFAIPLGAKYLFHRTTDPVLITTYRTYFESLPLP